MKYKKVTRIFLGQMKKEMRKLEGKPEGLEIKKRLEEMERELVHYYNMDKTIDPPRHVEIVTKKPRLKNVETNKVEPMSIKRFKIAKRRVFFEDHPDPRDPSTLKIVYYAIAFKKDEDIIYKKG